MAEDAAAGPSLARVDCLIVGAGPAGLTAAIYAARFRLSVLVVDGGAGRASLIPCTRNHAGFPDGISGVELLARMRRQAELAGAARVSGRVRTIRPVTDGFVAAGDFGDVRARAVLLATGVVNRRPDIAPETHDDAVMEGRLRYCPVCDGFEVIDQRLAVVGSGEHGVREAIFLRAYTPDVTLIAPDGPHQLLDADRERLARLGVEMLDGPARGLILETGAISLTANGQRVGFDCVYPALGSDVRSELGAALGAATTDDGCLPVDAHQRTSVPRLYAAGDVVLGLDQISHAMGQAGVAATTLRNDLAEELAIVR
jgi:thioredoxin reductase (NADPH)